MLSSPGRSSLDPGEKIGGRRATQFGLWINLDKSLVTHRSLVYLRWNLAEEAVFSELRLVATG